MGVAPTMISLLTQGRYDWCREALVALAVDR